MILVGDVEDAILDRLDSLKTELGLRAVETYGGQLATKEEIKTLLNRFPCVLLHYEGGDLDSENQQVIEDFFFVAFICDRNVRSDNEARRGGESGNPGTYAIMDAVKESLLHYTPLEGMTPIEISRPSRIASEPNISIYAMILHTEGSYTQEYSRDDEEQ